MPSPEPDITELSATTDSAAYDAGAVEADERRRGLGIALIISAILLVVLWWLLSNTVVVPDVVGMSLLDARTTLSEAKLKSGAVSRVASKQYQPGEVADQAPFEGRRVFKGTMIDLAVATGAEDFVDVNPEAIPGAGNVGFEPDTGSTGGSALSTQPAPRTYAPADLGPQVPMVQALTEKAARAKLADAGYRVTVKYGPSTAGPGKGYVFYQNPAPYTYENRGTTVLIWVSTGGPDGGYPYPQPVPQ